MADDELTVPELTQLLLDITNGVPVPRNESPARRRARARLTAQVDAIVALGGTVDIPPELP